MKKSLVFRILTLVTVLSAIGGSLSRAVQTKPPVPEITLTDDERLITILGTNDIHGGVEPHPKSDGERVGGLAFFSGVVKATRAGIQNHFGNRAGVLVVDAGDQFQGTLVSNFNEGQLLFKSMIEVGYDAAIPGNHDYDFGPKGWLKDRVEPAPISRDRSHGTSNGSQNDPRGALRSLVNLLKKNSPRSFPLLSANTYFKSSIQDKNGVLIPVSSIECRPEVAQDSVRIDWSRAEAPYFKKSGDFLQPYLIKEVAGVRVAIIGIDHPTTPTTTTPENVQDLCFRDEADAYLELRAKLEGKADIFLMVIHNGEADTQHPVLDVVKRIASANPNALHAVIAGHTHQTNHEYLDWNQKRIPIIQSYPPPKMFTILGGKAYGRIDLVWDSKARQLVTPKTRSFASILLYQNSCPPSVDGNICQASPQKTVFYEGVPVETNIQIQKLIELARQKVSKLAGLVMGTADAPLTKNRKSDSPEAEMLTDGLLGVAQASTGGMTPGLAPEIAMMNTGGMRAELVPNPTTHEINYEDLFQVIPFNNHGVVVGPVDAPRLIGLLTRSVQTCGSYGALLQSGLRVSFERDCEHRDFNGVDRKAHLLRVETVKGELIFDSEKGGILPSALGRTFNIVTLDFLADGGSGYNGFSDGVNPPKKLSDLGIVREALAKLFAKKHPHFSTQLDGRWQEVKPATVPSPAPSSVPPETGVDPGAAPSGTPDAEK